MVMAWWKNIFSSAKWKSAFLRDIVLQALMTGVESRRKEKNIELPLGSNDHLAAITDRISLQLG